MHRQSIAFGFCLVTMLTVAGSPAVYAQGFALQVGPPVAVMPLSSAMGASSWPGAVMERKVNDVAFVVRPVHCADPGSARMTATAEGLVAGVRRSVPLTLRTLVTPGVHAVSGRLPTTSGWVVSLTGECAGAVAGALVTLGPMNTYRRDAVQLVAGAPTVQQVEQALRASAIESTRTAAQR